MNELPDSESVICPWCKEEFVIDFNQAAFGYVCPHCSEESSLSSIQNPNDNPHALEIYKGVSEAVAANVYRYSLGFIKDSDPSLPVLSSGTLVEIDGRRFIATARHTIPAKPRNKLGFVSKILSHTQELIRLTILNYGKESEDGPDVGFLEIADDEKLSAMGLEILPFDRISDFGVGDGDRPSRVFGYPRDWVAPNVKRQSTELCAMCLGAETIDPSYWDTIDREARSPDPTRDIILRYDRNQKYISWGSNKFGDDLAEPFGMSGGGCWQSPKPITESHVWSAEELHLYGIQSTWPRKQRFLKAVQVIHWLRLVADHYSDLKDELIERYPRILQLDKHS